MYNYKIRIFYNLINIKREIKIEQLRFFFTMNCD